ncbi:MAG: FtsQ-type POTRA domain-containing protein [Geitlerinemataceae cyanobacterium]
MTKELVSSFSHADLRNRRQHLRRQRGVKSLQTGWRVLVVGGFAGGMFWVTTLPDWVIRRPEQVAIEGNELLSPKSVRSLLNLSYPQSLLRLHPDTLAQQLEAQGPIARATVRRKLFPPSLTVDVRERYPVAVAYLPTSTSPPKASAPVRPSQKSATAGLLDENGVWIPLDSYQDLNPGVTLPQLKVKGDPQWYGNQWSQVYSAIRKSPVTVAQIDWRDRSNLILETDLGLVHCGPDRHLLPQQLQALDRMRNLPEKIDPDEIAYLDLKNPDAPYVRMKSPKPPTPKPSQPNP